MTRRRPTASNSAIATTEQGPAMTAMTMGTSAYLRQAAAANAAFGRRRGLPISRLREDGRIENVPFCVAEVTESTHGRKRSREHPRSFHSRRLGQQWASRDRAPVSQREMEDRRWHAVHQASQRDQHQARGRLGLHLRPIQVALHELHRLTPHAPGPPPLPRGQQRLPQRTVKNGLYASQNFRACQQISALPASTRFQQTRFKCVLSGERPMNLRVSS